MTDEVRDILTRDLAKIAKKHNLRYCAFCGTTAEDEFYGAAVGDKVIQTDVFNIALNVGRLWQHFRGLSRDVLNAFEKEVWK